MELPQMPAGMPDMGGGGMPPAGMPPMPPAPMPPAPEAPMPPEGGAMPNFLGGDEENASEDATETPVDEAQESTVSSTDTKGNAMKKELLQKMMSNLLNKPGRSVNEMINGVKSVIGAYKNFAKEIDQLNGIDPSVSSDNANAETSALSSGSGDEIQKMLRSIQSKKSPQESVPTVDGGGGPGFPMVSQPPVQQMPQQPQYNTPPPYNSLGMFGY
jgi:hypothetical protein